MPTIRVLVEEPPCLDLKGLDFGTRELSFRERVGICGYILSSRALNGVASQEPGGCGARLAPKNPRVPKGGPTCKGLMTKPFLFMVVDKKALLSLVLFRWVAPPF
jgi:hypothetical protein